MRGEVVIGNEVGEISVRGKLHPVYDTITAKTFISPKTRSKPITATLGGRGR